MKKGLAIAGIGLILGALLWGKRVSSVVPSPPVTPTPPTQVQQMQQYVENLMPQIIGTNLPTTLPKFDTETFLTTALAEWGNPLQPLRTFQDYNGGRASIIRQVQANTPYQLSAEQLYALATAPDLSNALIGGANPVLAPNFLATVALPTSMRQAYTF